MTLQITSLEMGLDVGGTVLTGIRNLNPTAVLAGGFLRDIDNGVQPKDMDIFMESPAGNMDATVAQADAIMKAFGHEYVRLGIHQGNQEDYPTHMTVFESTKWPEDSLPLNLIYTTRNQPHDLMFDLGLCNIYMWTPGRIDRSREYIKDKEDRVIGIRSVKDSWLHAREPLDFDRSFARLVNHFQRVQAKFPDFRLALDYSLVVNSRAEEFIRLYEALIEGGHLGDPRAILQAEAPVIDWDAIRQPDRAADLEELEQRAAARILTAQQRAAFMEAATNQVRDRAQVQPRLVDNVGIQALRAEDEWNRMVGQIGAAAGGNAPIPRAVERVAVNHAPVGAPPIWIDEFREIAGNQAPGFNPAEAADQVIAWEDVQAIPRGVWEGFNVRNGDHQIPVPDAAPVPPARDARGRFAARPAARPRNPRAGRFGN